MSRNALILSLLVAACGGRSIDSTPTSNGGSSGTFAGGRAGDGSGGSNRGGAPSSGTGGASGSAPLAGSGGASVGAGGFAGATGGAGFGGVSGSAAGNGGAAGSGGAMGGSGGDAGVTGGTSGSAGVAGVAGVGGQPEPTLTPCNSSLGTGCAAGEVCTVIYSGPCNPSFDEDCVGYCAPTLPASECEEGLAQCGTVTLCEEPPPGQCPLGQRRSFVNNCWGPCVPADCCACEREEDCQPNEDLGCDKQTGRCVVPAAPAPRCFLPFEIGACEQPTTRIAFVDGKCQETSVCANSEDLELLFFTLAECLRHCEGSPQQSECPEGRTVAELCIACGAGGGCAKSGTVCAEPCMNHEDCDNGSCRESLCQFVCF